MANSVDPDQTAGSTLLATILNSSVMLGNYLQQTASADNILDAFFLGALRVKISALKRTLLCSMEIYSHQNVSFLKKLMIRGSFNKE